MRERRWETTSRVGFGEVLALGQRLASLGLKPADPAKDIICYIEEWAVDRTDDFDRLDPWPTEDVTLVLVHERWHGDFFLLVGGYHTLYQRHQGTGTYCSISHPWTIPGSLRTLHERGMFWLGFRHRHGFIRVRLDTTEVVTPGETRADDEQGLWLQERQQAFLAAGAVLQLSLTFRVDRGKMMLATAEPHVPFFCSWPDAFGPCQFEYNTSDPFEFLVPASQLAATYRGASTSVRAYLTGFSESALEEFQTVHPGARPGYRCSAHCPLDELPEVLRAVGPDGRLYATLCEFQSQQLRPDGEDASVIVGIVGSEGTFDIEVRFNRAPLSEGEMAGWLEQVLGLPVRYAPLPPFP